MHSPDRQALALHRDHSILLVKDCTFSLHILLWMPELIQATPNFLRPIPNMAQSAVVNPLALLSGAQSEPLPLLALSIPFPNVRPPSTIWTPPSCKSPALPISSTPFSAHPSNSQPLVIPKRRRPVRNLRFRPRLRLRFRQLCCPPPNCKIYRRTSIY